MHSCLQGYTWDEIASTDNEGMNKTGSPEALAPAVISPQLAGKDVDQNPVHTKISAPALCWAASPLAMLAASLQQVLALGHVVSWWRDKRKHMFIKLVLFPLFSFSHRVSWVLHFLWALLSSLYNAVTRGDECPCSYRRVNNWSLNCVFWTREMTLSSWKSQLRRHRHINANTGTYSHAHITEFCKIKW